MICISICHSKIQILFETGIKKVWLMTVYFYIFKFFSEEKDIELAARVPIALIFRSRDAKFTEQFSLSTYAV